MDEIISCYRVLSERLFRVVSETACDWVIQELRKGKDWRNYLISSKMDEGQIERYRANPSLIGTFLSEEWVRQANAMDIMLLGGDGRLKRRVINDFNKRGFKIENAASEVIHGIWEITKELDGKSIREVAGIMLVQNGLYGIKTITGENDVQNAKPKFSAHSAFVYMAMINLDYACKSHFFPGKQKRRQLRGDKQDWGKPRFDGDKEGYDFLKPEW